VKSSSALFLCTCRGKLSEGLNFRDDLARACFVIGIPFMHTVNSRVVLKKDMLDREFQRRAREQASPGQEWYKTNAIREVNQIIGRCIRHARDYACIFLVDDRYGTD